MNNVILWRTFLLFFDPNIFSQSLSHCPANTFSCRGFLKRLHLVAFMLICLHRCTFQVYIQISVSYYIIFTKKFITTHLVTYTKYICLCHSWPAVHCHAHSIPWIQVHVMILLSCCLFESCTFSSNVKHSRSSEALRLFLPLINLAWELPDL